MIILITKSFSGKDKYYKGDKGKDYKDAPDLLMDLLKGQMRKEMEEEEKKKNKIPPRPNKKKDGHLKKLQEDTAGFQRDIDIHKAEEEFKRKKEELENLRNPKPAPDTRSKFEKFKDNAKSKMSDPKFKKGLKYAGIGTAIAAGTAGAVYGGIKLKKKIDQKKSNKKIKEQIAGKDNE